VSNVRIERQSGPLRLARLPGESQPVAAAAQQARWAKVRQQKKSA